MTQKNHQGKHWLILFLISFFFYNGQGQTPIKPYFFGVNAWMPDTIGDVNNCASPPCIKYGKLHNNWQKVEDSKAQIVRYGGISPDKNKPTNYQYIRMIDSIRANGMEPIIQVPYWDGRWSATQAAAIVQYINVTRGKGIKYWVIGNEPDLKYGATNASHVAPYIKAFSSAMKAVDSTIKIIGPETAWFNQSIIDGLTQPGGTNDITGKDSNGRYYVDIISFHTYPMGDNNTSLPTRAQVISKLTSSGSFESDLTYLNGRLATANAYHNRTGTYALEAAVTEANVVYQNSSTDNVYGLGANSFLGAQFVSELYGISMNKGLVFVNLWSVIEGNSVPASLGFVDHYTGVKKPLYYHFKMMAENFKGNAITATDNQTNVKVFASKNGQQTSVMIMNQELSTNHIYALNLNTVAITGSQSLKMNVNAGINAQHTGTLQNQSSVLLQFDGAGNLTHQCVYSLSLHASSNLPPSCTNFTPTAPVDLVINTVSANTTSAQAGSTVSLSASVFNGGSSTASVSKVGFYLSSDSLLGNGDQLLTTINGAGLNASASALRQGTASIPTGVSAGNHFILAVADPLNEVSETNENNNVKSMIFTVLPNGGVDLVVQNAALSSTAVTAGATLTLTSTLFNAGALAGNSGKLGYYLSTDTILGTGDNLLAFAASQTLAANSGAQKSATVNLPGTLTPQFYYILFKADYASEVNETNELNNVSWVKIQVAAPLQPDLSVISVTTNPSAALAGATISVGANVLNAGLGTASLSGVGFYLSADSLYNAGDSFLGAAAGGSLNASGSALRQTTAVIPSGKTAGSYFILAVADHNNALAESNESNNVKVISFAVQAPQYVDLQIKNAAATSSSVQAGSVITVSAQLYNGGNAVASNARAGYYFSANNLFDNNDIFISAEAGQTINSTAGVVISENIAVPGAMAAGAHYILVVADHAGEISESDEQNNVSAIPFTVVAASFVDLQVNAASASATSAVAGNTVALNATVYNSGNATASVSTVGFYLSSDTMLSNGDDFLGFVSGNSLLANSVSQKNAVVTIPTSKTAGKYYILCAADHNNAIVEADENNNVMALSFSVGPDRSGYYPDLVVQSMSVSPGNIIAGDKISLNATIYNAGNIASQSSKLGYYLSSDTVFDSADTFLGFSMGNSLAAGTGAGRNLNYKTSVKQTPGLHYVLFFADHTTEVSESNEGNNIGFMPLMITARKQEVKLTRVSSSEKTMQGGKTYMFESSVSNLGNVESSVRVRYFLSADSVFDISDVLISETAYQNLAINNAEMEPVKGMIPANVFEGSYFVVGVADHNGEMPELDLGDNVLVTPVEIVSQLTGLSGEEADLSSLKIFPNPTAGHLNIMIGQGADERGGTQIELLDINGRQVFVSKVASFGNRQEIDLPSSLIDGIYILRIHFESGVVSRQILLGR